MKSYITFILTLVCAYVSAQNINDVLRYSADDLQGTARFQSMSGAFGALGGDLSSLNINPAGSAVFNNSLFSVTGNNYNKDNTANYFNTSNAGDLNSFEINQIGGVFIFKNQDESSNWKKLAVAINYDIVNNFDNRTFVSGNSTQSIDSYFLQNADGVPFGDLLLRDGEFIEEAYLDIGANLGFVTQQAFLGYFGGIIDSTDDTNEANTNYVSNASFGDRGTVNQSYRLNEIGYNSKFTANMSGQYQDNLYVGASLNFHNILYDRISSFRESGFDEDSEIQFINFDNFLRTLGSGFSFSLGAIAKVNDNIRVGGSYQSPTWYRLTDELSQRINSDLADDDINFIDFNQVNVFERYRIKTPGKLTGSLALVFAKDGLLSFDYGYQDMSQSELRPASSDSFSAENNFIANTLGSVSSYRIGGEYRIERVSLRGGYRYEDSPYVDGVTVGDLNGFSAGLGYNFGGSKLDLGFNRTERDFALALFDTGLNTSATVNNINTNIALTYTLNF